MRLTSLLIAASLGLARASLAAVPEPVEAEHGMVVSSQHLASAVGVQILKAGGNAVDAAVAVGYAEAVTNPCCGNIGGGGFMVLHLADGRERFLNFREMAPAAATANMYLDAAGNPIEADSRFGYKAVAIPGTVMGLDHALKEFGTLSRERVMQPAIDLARNGFILSEGDVAGLGYGQRWFAHDPEVAKVFLHADGSGYRVGERFVQKDLAATLERIAKEGPDAFYKGAIPDEVAKASAAHGGIITAADFAHFTVTEADPLRCSYRGYQIVSAPPPSSGGVTLCEILNILQGYDMAALGFHSAQSIHLTVEAMRHAYLDRNSYLGDPAFVNNPIEHLLSPDYAAAIRAKILADNATPSTEVAIGTPPHEKSETTHFSIVDHAGNAVAMTYTINGGFGAVVMAAGTGFLLNDEMDDFSAKPGTANMFELVQGHADSIAPGKRPLSSMTPTIVLRDGKPFIVTGSPGGSRIITIVLETITDMLDYGMSVNQAVDAPRFHHQWLPDQISLEPFAVSPDTAKLLTGMGYKLEVDRGWGAAESIEVGPGAGSADQKATAGIDSALAAPLEAGRLYGAHDDRREAGGAAGY
jgi:gamma-glutamyltranspeptidase/glutathione hydrolase